MLYQPRIGRPEGKCRLLVNVRSQYFIFKSSKTLGKLKAVRGLPSPEKLSHKTSNLLEKGMYLKYVVNSLAVYSNKCNSGLERNRGVIQQKGPISVSTLYNS